VNDDNGFGVPAGWYPDPLGLPQMRWWDNHGWTEHTTEARAPIVIQEAKLAWADDDLVADELPTRRERREREREDSGVDRGTTNASAQNADALLELEGPSWDVLPADEPAPAVIPEFSLAEGEALLSSQATATATTPQPAVVQQAAPVEQPVVATAPYLPETAPSASTAGAWIIALMPLIQLVLILLLVSAASVGGVNVSIILGILLAPYPFSIPFAIADQRRLKKQGYANAASWAWVLLSGPIYLIARAIRIVMKSGNGFGPVLVWGALVLLQLGSVIAVPGLVISALPQTFSAQAAQSIQQQASVIGHPVTVLCPSPPATVMGQQFVCTLTRTDNAQTYKVTASLERLNGWIAWPVVDYGVYSLNR
jgi:Protein of unknown function (DUF2510)